MLKVIMGFAVAGTLLMPASVLADPNEDRDPLPGSARISAEAMTKKINELGYDVRRLTSEAGHFEAQIVERKSGSVVKAKFNRNDGELIYAEVDR